MDQNTVVITGASGGIGAALAKRLGSKGFRLVLGARREVELHQVARECGPDVLPVVTDVTRRAEVELVRDRALEKFGRVDVWVNNAGRGIGKKTLELTDQDFDEMMAVNVKSALYGMQAILPHIQSRGDGQIINVSSFLGRVPLVSYRSAYNAAKAALNSLTANARMDLRREYSGIHISLVMPGVVLTDFPKHALASGTPPTWTGSSDAKPQTAEEVAAIMEELIRNPKPEVYTNPASHAIAARYYQDVAGFETFGGPPKSS